jgi:hypothetical protein
MSAAWSAGAPIRVMFVSIKWIAGHPIGAV